MKKNRMIIIIIAAVVIAGIGFGAGMMVKSSVASKAALSMDDVKQIALSSVGVSAEKATFTKTQFDEGVYEVDFYTESNEYGFDINADTGAIIDRDVAPRDLSLPVEDIQQSGDSTLPAAESHEYTEQATESSTQHAQSASSATQPATQQSQAATAATQPATHSSNDNNVIGVAAAKAVALNHAGISSASFTKAHLDHDDGIRVYDIEFIADGKEYDYEINAYTGAIIEYDIDRLDYDD